MNNMDNVNQFAINALSNPEPRSVRESLQAFIKFQKASEGGLSALKSADRRFVATVLNRLGQDVLDHIKASVKAEDLAILDIVTTHRAKAVK